MLGLKFGKLPRHRTYSYTPVYYNEQKEDLENRVRKVKREMNEGGKSIEEVKANIRYGFSRTAPERYSKSPWEKFYGLRIILLSSVIGFLVYLVYSSQWFVHLLD